ALAFELLLVDLVGAQRLALRQQEVAGKTVLDLDRLAHLAQARNAFEKNDFHGSVPFQVRPSGLEFRNRLEARSAPAALLFAVLPAWRLGPIRPTRDFSSDLAAPVAVRCRGQFTFFRLE